MLQYRAIVFTVSKNGTEKPDDTVKKVKKDGNYPFCTDKFDKFDIFDKFDKFDKNLPYLDHF